MKINKLFVITSILLSSASGFAYADITVTNNTAAYVTGRLSTGPCSSSIGSSGVVMPHSPFNIPQSAINFVCGFGTCNAQVFMTNNCSGKRVATVTVDKKNGITNIKNDDVDSYILTGSGSSVTITGGPAKKSFFDFLFS